MCCLVIWSNFALLLTIQFASLISSLINIISLLLTTFDWTKVRGIAPRSHTGRPRICLVAAKLAEMENWKKNDVFEKVQDCGQPTISVRWIISEKMKEGSPVIKARLVARGFEEDLSGSPTDSPTCSRDALRISLVFIALKRWKCFTVT